MMKIGVLALQGAFIEHENRLKELGAECVEIRNAYDLAQDFDGIILPGGESTVQGKLLREGGMLNTLRTKIESGVPVLATCAGMILLAERLEDDNAHYLSTMPIVVKRNAYGRQLGSFHTQHEFAGLGQIPMTFIRAPYATAVGNNTDVLAEVDGRIVAVKYKNQLALAFHPELDTDTHIHQLFLQMV